MSEIHVTVQKYCMYKDEETLYTQYIYGWRLFKDFFYILVSSLF